MIKPRRLQSGDRVALVAPASPFNHDDLEAGVAELARLGFEAVYDARIFERSRFVAGSAASRAAQLADAWRDPSIAAIVAIRGGYGSVQLLPLVDGTLMRDAAKAFIAYSDPTALLCFHLQHGLVCFHGPMIEGRFARGDAGYHRQSFEAALCRREPMGELMPPRIDALRHGEARGPLVGGTLTQLAALLGTPWAYAPPRGCVLFLEDVAERPYRLDRMLTQLSQAGLMARASAVVFGEFPGCGEPDGEVAARDVLATFATAFDGPVIAGFPSGHTAGPTWTLPFGVDARVVTRPQPMLVVEEPAVG